MEFKTFEELTKINVSEKTEQKGGFTYLSWAWAWSEFKKARPDASYKIKKFNDVPYLKTDEGFMVFTEITSLEETHEMWLPVMDFKNKALLTANVMDINKTIMRCLVKNMAMFGLGLYIYAGEDLPEDEEPKVKKAISKSNEINPLWFEAQSCGIDLDKLAIYYKKKTIDEVSDEDIKKAIEMKIKGGK